MKKRMRVLLLAALVLSLTLAASALYSGDCGDAVTWTLDPDTGVLTVSGTGAMTDYGWTDSAPWIDYAASITSVVIEDGVTAIGESAFGDSTLLKQVTIPDSVTSLGDYAFYNCTALTDVTLPRGDVFVGRFVFSNTAIREIVIPDGWTSLGSSTFDQCKEMKKITIPASVVAMDEAFLDFNVMICCSANSPAYDYATTWGYDVELVFDPDEEIPTSGYCGERLTWKYTADTKTLAIAGNGPMFDFQYNNYPWIQLEVTSATIGDYVTSVGKYAFYGSALTEVTLGASIKEIRNGAFQQCRSLTEIEFPNALESIGNYAFCSSGVTAITLPENVVKIGSHAFYVCEKLLSVSICNESLEIGKDAFVFCGTNTGGIPNAEFTIACYPASTAEAYAHANNVAIRYFAIEGGNSGTCGDGLYWAYYAETGRLSIYGTGAMDNYEHKVSSAPWADCDVRTITIGEGVTGIGLRAFDGQSNCIAVSFPSTLEYIADEAFYECTALTGIELDDQLKEIGSRAFAYCTGLQEVTLGAGVESIRAFAFSNCSSLWSFTITARETEISSVAFYVVAYYTTPVFYCYKNSTAETAAKEKGFPVSYLDAEEEEPIAGDVDGDGAVTVVDCLTALRDMLNGTSTLLADVNGDGEVTLMDIMRILRTCTA